MSTLSEFFATIGEYLRSLIPFVIIDDWEQGAKTYLGRIVKTCTSKNGLHGTGLHMYWPVLGGVEIQDTNLSTMQSDDQTLTTKDGETVVVAMTLLYYITDVGCFYLYIHDQDETIQNALESSIGRWVQDLTWFEQELYDGAEEWMLKDMLVTQVEKDLQERLGHWGVAIDDLSLHTLTRARAHRLIS